MGEEPAPELSIIIVTWNSAEFMGACLDALQTATAGIPHEIIVVDNASEDATCSLLLARGFQQGNDRTPLRLVRNTFNEGFARANNRGLALARAPLVLFLNPDTEPGPTSIQIMMEYLRAHGDVVAVGPKLVRPDGEIQGGAAGHDPSLWTLFNYAFALYHLSPRRFPAVWLARRQYRSNTPISVDWVSGAALMARKDDAQAVGGWPADRFLYMEDIAFCRRLRQRGKIVCLPQAEVVHHIGHSVHPQGTAGIERNILGLHQDYLMRFSRRRTFFLHLLGSIAFGLRWGAATLLGARVPRGHSAPAPLLWRTCTLTSLRCAWQVLVSRPECDKEHSDS